MTDEWQIAAVKYYEHTQIQKSEQFFSKLSFKTSFPLSSECYLEWAFCRTPSAGVVQASIILSIPRAAKDTQDTLRYFSLKPTEWRLSMLCLSPVRKQRGEKKGSLSQWPLNRSTVKHDSCMGTLWKPEIDPLSSKKRSTFNSRKDQIKGERTRS